MSLNYREWSWAVWEDVRLFAAGGVRLYGVLCGTLGSFAGQEEARVGKINLIRRRLVTSS